MTDIDRIQSALGFTSADSPDIWGRTRTAITSELDHAGSDKSELPE